MPTSSCVESPSTALALEVLVSLMVDEDLEIVKVALTIVAPRPLKQLLQAGMPLLVLRHDGLWVWVVGLQSEER